VQRFAPIDRTPAMRQRRQTALSFAAELPVSVMLVDR
jgi:hypothetical protein